MMRPFDVIARMEIGQLNCRNGVIGAIVATTTTWLRIKSVIEGATNSEMDPIHLPQIYQNDKTE